MLPEISQALSVLLLARNDTGCGAHCLTVLNLASQSCANVPTRGASLSFRGHSKWPELVAVLKRFGRNSTVLFKVVGKSCTCVSRRGGKEIR